MSEGGGGDTGIFYLSIVDTLSAWGRDSRRHVTDQAVSRIFVASAQGQGDIVLRISRIISVESAKHRPKGLLKLRTNIAYM